MIQVINLKKLSLIGIMLYLPQTTFSAALSSTSTTSTTITGATSSANKDIWHTKRTIPYVAGKPLIDRIKGMLGMLAEVAMDKFDKQLGFNMVPTVKLELENKTDGTQNFTLSSLKIQPKSITTSSGQEEVLKIQHSDELKKIITPLEWMRMNIFLFLVGQYDRTFSNLIIDQNNKLYLIDNEAVARVNQIVFGYSNDKRAACAWVPLRILQNTIPQTEPLSLEATLQQNITPEGIAKIHAAFPKPLDPNSQDLIDQWTRLDIDAGYCRLYQGQLWRQLYARNTNIDAPFSATITLELLKQLRSLTAENLVTIWPELPYKDCPQDEKAYSAMIKKFAEATLTRRDMIVEYFVAHPESVVTL